MGDPKELQKVQTPKIDEIAFFITLRKGSQEDRLGVEVAVSEVNGRPALLIQSINSTGLLRNWKIEHPASSLNIGDSIVEVNGVRDDCMEMCRTILSDMVLKMIISRGKLVRRQDEIIRYFLHSL